MKIKDKWTKFNKKKRRKLEKNKELQELYKITTQNALNESQVVWQFSTAFTVSNTIFISFISQAPKFNLIYLLLSVAGFLISLLWFVSFKRRWAWYEFRMFQVKQRGPEIWYLAKHDGEFFSDGYAIKDKNEIHQIPFLGRIFRTKYVFYFLIFIFILLYLFFILNFFVFKIPNK